MGPAHIKYNYDGFWFLDFGWQIFMVKKSRTNWFMSV